MYVLTALWMEYGYIRLQQREGENVSSYRILRNYMVYSILLAEGLPVHWPLQREIKSS